MDQETSETSNEIAGQVNKAVSEFREEASKADIAPIVKDLQRALEEQSQKTSTVEDYMQSSVESEKAVFADITRLSNSLGGILETQRGILESLKGLNDNIDTATQQQGDDAGGGGDAGAAGGGGDARHAAFGGAITGSNPFVALASYSGGSGGSGGGGYGGGGGTAPSIPKGEMAETLKSGIVERLVSDEELAVDPEKAEMIAEAFVLNFNDESGLDPNVIEREPNVHGTRGKGLYQLTDTDPGVGRRSDYEAIYGDDYSVENQLDFLVHELKTSESSAWSGIKDSETVGEAAGKIVRDFLRPAEQYKIERSNKYSGDVRTTSDFDGVVEKPEPIDGALTPLSLNWIGDELPEGVTEGLNQTTLSDPISGESFPVEFEVENVEGKFITTGPVTLTEDTDLEGVSGVAGDAVEVSAEMAQELAGQIGATIEPSDIETPANLEVEETNIEYRDKMLEAGGTVLGGSVFNTSPNFSPETENAMLTPLSLNWVGEELPEGITEGSNEITLTDPDSGEEFSVNFEVENIDGNLTTVGPVTLAQDTDLEGISGAAGDPVEVSAEMAQDLADQIGATLEPTDPETPATPEELGADNNIPETMATAVDLEKPVMDNPPTEGTAAGSQATQTQTAAADYGEDKTTPVSFTGGKWNKQVSDYFGVA